MLSNQTLIKFAQVQNLINQHYRVKRAYGVGDDFEYIDRLPYDGLQGGSKKELIRDLKRRLASLKKNYVNRLYNHPIYDGYPPEIYVSQHRYHEDDYGSPNEISLDAYTNLVNNALKSKKQEALENAASYWSMRASITDPKARKAIQQALKNYKG